MCLSAKLINVAAKIVGALKRRAHSRWIAVPKTAYPNSASPRFRLYQRATASFKGGSEAVARGIAIGLFIGLTPTFGFQTALMITACILLAGNFPVAFASSFVSNPITVAPLYWGFHELGEAMLSALPIFGAHGSNGIIRGAIDEIVFTGFGSLLIAIPVSLGAYFITRLVLTTISFRRNRHQHLIRHDQCCQENRSNPDYS